MSVLLHFQYNNVKLNAVIYVILFTLLSHLDVLFRVLGTLMCSTKIDIILT